jgi:hypothetical protein
VIEAFTFSDGDRTFTCATEAQRPPHTEVVWWWFRVSTDDRNRYAPFRAASGDTKASVQMRIVAYYDDLLVKRALPPTSYWQRRQAGADAAVKPLGTATQV